PPFEQVRNIIADVARRLFRRRDFSTIGGKDFGDHRRARRLGLILVPDVLCETPFSISTVSFAAASADEVRSVSNDPLLPSVIKVKSWTFRTTRHFSTILRMSDGLVNSFLPIR